MQQVEMNQWDEVDYIDAEIEEDTPLFGVCSKCLGSGYVIRERDGVMGVLFTTTNHDEEGKPKRRLVSCDCKVQVSY